MSVQPSEDFKEAAAQLYTGEFRSAVVAIVDNTGHISIASCGESFYDKVLLATLAQHEALKLARPDAS